MKIALAASMSLALSLSAPAAWAQPTGQPADDAAQPPEPGADQPQPEPAPEPEPEPEPEPTPPPRVQPPPPPVVAEVPRSPGRPDQFSVGFGFGWNFPADLQVPDTTSVRFRFPSGLIIEPALEISRVSDHSEVGGVESDDSTVTFAVAGDARVPLVSSSSMDLEIIGGGSLAFSHIGPEGADNDTSLTAASLFYGIAVDLWIRSHWAISFTTNNPLVLYQRSSMNNPGGDVIDSTTQLGIIFNPDVLLMLHLFFD